MRQMTLAIVSVVTALVLFIGAGCSVNKTDDTFATPRVGSTATFQEYPRWGISGTVTVVDARTLRFDDFSYHGDTSVPAEIRLQKNFNKVATLKDLTDQTFDHATFLLAIPNTVALSDFDLVVVFSPAFNTSVSGAAF
ncbi:MAG: DM13 domain-containing protein [Candidatus Kerfeldbacteria bacterium]